MVLCCSDSEEMDALSKCAKNVTTLWIVPVTHFLVESYGVYTFLVDHIFPINQLNGKEHIYQIKYNLKERLTYWVNVKKQKKVRNYEIMKLSFII